MTPADALARIDTFADLKPGWDSYWGKPTTGPARRVAKALVRWAAANGATALPWPCPTPAGGIEFADEDEACEIEIGPDGSVGDGG